MVASFGLLILQVTGQEAAGVTQRYNVEQARRDFARAKETERAARRLPDEQRR